MNEILKLIEYDLLDIKLTDNISNLELHLIWSEDEGSRLILNLNQLSYLDIKKLASRKEKNQRQFPFFVEKLLLNESAVSNNAPPIQITQDDISSDEKIFHLKVLCIEMIMEATCLGVVINDNKGSRSYGNGLDVSTSQ